MSARWVAPLRSLEMPKSSMKNAGAVTPSRSQSVLALAEEAEERFDEACEHARLRPAHAGLTLGPSLSVPMARLRAGRLAWRREVHAKDGDAEVYYSLDPGAPLPRGGPGELPVLDLEPARVVCDLRVATGSPERLIGVSPRKGAPRGLRSFVEAVRAELASDSD